MAKAKPEPLATNTSADGKINVAYFEKPYRHYTINGDKVPSVTQAIGVVDKSRPLQYYTETQTIRGVSILARKGYELTDPAKIKDGLQKFKLRFMHRTQDAANRGVDVHGIAERWLERGEIPNLKDYPKSRHGFVRGFAKWLMTAKPDLVDSEMVVGSLKYGYGGRLDMTIIIRGHDGRTSLRDIKTSKGVYPRSHFPQLMAYENARVEMGLPPTDDQGILLLTQDGEYREVLARDVEFEDFRVLLEAHKSQSRIPERI